MSARPNWAVARGPSNLLPYIAFAGTDHGGLLPLRETCYLHAHVAADETEGLLTGFGINCAEKDRVESLRVLRQQARLGDINQRFHSLYMNAM